MKTFMKLGGSVIVLALLGIVMAYLAGFFETKIPIDFRGVVPSTVDGQTIKVQVISGLTEGEEIIVSREKQRRTG